MNVEKEQHKAAGVHSKYDRIIIYQYFYPENRLFFRVSSNVVYCLYLGDCMRATVLESYAVLLPRNTVIEQLWDRCVSE